MYNSTYSEHQYQMDVSDMMWLGCDIYLLQLGFHPVAVVSKLVQMYAKGETIHKTQNTLNRKQTYK